MQSLALTRLSHLEEALLTVGKFEEAYQELQSWLVQAWDKLQSLEPIPSQSEAVIALYAKHKVNRILYLLVITINNNSQLILQYGLYIVLYNTIDNYIKC